MVNKIPWRDKINITNKKKKLRRLEGEVKALEEEIGALEEQVKERERQ